jgi:hypothetical protein
MMPGPRCWRTCWAGWPDAFPAGDPAVLLPDAQRAAADEERREPPHWYASAAIVSGSAAALHNAGSPGAPRLVVAAVVSQAPAPRSAEEGGTDLETGMVTCLRANSHPQRKQGVHVSLSRIAGRW